MLDTSFDCIPEPLHTVLVRFRPLQESTIPTEGVVYAIASHSMELWSSGCQNFSTLLEINIITFRGENDRVVRPGRVGQAEYFRQSF